MEFWKSWKKISRAIKVKMEDNRTLDIGEQFLSYLNDTGETISGYFEIVELNQSYVKIRTRGNYVIIPMSRVLKIKIKEKTE